MATFLPEFCDGFHARKRQTALGRLDQYSSLFRIAHNDIKENLSRWLKLYRILLKG